MVIDVRKLGARGDGSAIDSAAINAAIVAAARQGGGTVLIPAGRYLCFSIRLLSHVTIQLARGAVIEAADPARHAEHYDPPEDRGEQLYQDFGHSHWRNSLFWGEDVENVAIVGPGLIHGLGLTRDGPGARWKAQTGERPLSMRQMSAAEIARHIHDLTIDTDRDGIDLDCVQRTIVERCRVNTPNDDAIVIKSSFALGRAVASEDVTVRHCAVSGYDLGTMLDGSRRTMQLLAPDRDRVTGRIKLGTESNGGYRRILIEDCSFTHCRGLALETVDGGVMEDVVARRITMRDVTTAPLFLRIGDRRRGPAGTQVGAIRRVALSDIDATGIDHRFAAAIAGLPGYPVEDVTLSRIHLSYRGGGTPEDAARRPEDLAGAYPEPGMFGVLPAWGLWVRHAKGLVIDRLDLAAARPDARPPFVIENTTGLSVTRTQLWRG
ncbi:MAG: glycoside hydrolase family 28 protein [Sphingomonas sp.]|nr:MAG: glycoside hydrolase family 28 protein [Sphingomonas sp.]